jgi:uncharacterized membrane protein
MAPQPNSVASVDRGLIDYTHWIYGLHALSVLIGLATAHAVVGRFAWGLPSIIAVIMNYARRSEARGTWLESHFRWQIRTFWYTWLWYLVTSLIAIPLMLVLIGFLIAIVGYALIGLWIIYRVARGWLALRDGRAMPTPYLVPASTPAV